MKKTYFLLPILMLLASCAQQWANYSPTELEHFDPKFREHIKKSEIAIGMDPIAVRYAWGAPHEIKLLPTDEEGNLREEWVYRKMGLYATKIVFKNGKLTDIVSGVVKLKLKTKKEETGDVPSGSDEGAEEVQDTSAPE